MRQHRIITGFTIIILSLAACSSGADELASSTTTSAAPTSTVAATAATTSTTFGGFQAGTFPASLEFGDTLRTFLFTVPPGYDGANPMPVIINLHGAGSSADSQAAGTGMTELAAERGYFVLHPQADGDARWDVRTGDDDSAYINSLLDQMEANFPLDPERVYVTGLSNGAGMANRLVCDFPDRYRALAGVAGAYDGAADCAAEEPIPVLAIHSIDDSVVPYEGFPPDYPALVGWATTWAFRDGCSTDPVETDIPNGTITEWTDCDGAASVTLYTLRIGGHTWFPMIEIPGSEPVATTALILDWFDGLAE
jgi:polyhydroxybutyrate depolymerase